MKRLLHLQHHYHTAKVLPHKHTSYRALFVLVALFGLSLLFIQRTVRAEDIVATAKISAPISTQPATISSPINGSTSSSTPVLAQGTCEHAEPMSVVELYVNNAFVGSAICSVSGVFSISIPLTVGANQLVVRTVNITDDYGPDSIPISITYTLPVISPSTSGATHATNTSPAAISTPSQDGTSTLSINSPYTYVTYGPAKDAEWTGSFQGGTAPYKVTIDWGDGTSSNYQDISTDHQTFRHHYSNYESYVITLTVIDSDGQTLSRQFAAITPYVAPVSQSNDFFSGEMVRIDKIMTYLGYGSTLALILLGVLTIIHSTPRYAVAHIIRKQPVRTQRHKRKR